MNERYSYPVNKKTSFRDKKRPPFLKKQKFCNFEIVNLFFLKKDMLCRNCIKQTMNNLRIVKDDNFTYSKVSQILCREKLIILVIFCI